MSVTVRVVKDTQGRGMQALADRLRAAANSRVKVGVPAGPTEPDGTSMALVAATVEFGKENQPERPFLRGGVRESLPRVSRLARHDLAAVAEGRQTISVALERTGALVVGSVKEYMTGDNFAPNAPSTIAKKGSEQPTIDTAALRGAITHVVEGDVDTGASAASSTSQGHTGTVSEMAAHRAPSARARDSHGRFIKET